MSIPIFTSQLKKAREATDLADIRAAKAAAVVEYMNNDSATWTEKYYDVGKGVLVTTKPSSGYGKGTETVGSESNKELGYKPGEVYTDKVIKITNVKPDGDVTMAWE